jgi:hypothetical protein
MEMRDLFLKLLEQLNSAVFTLIAILFAVGWSIYKIGSWGGKWSEKFKNQDSRIDKIENLSNTVVEIKTKIDLIYQYTSPHTTMRTHSPFSLTPIGEDIKKKINVDAMFSKYENELCNFVEKSKTKSAYDIQEESLKVVKKHLLNMLDEKELTAIKDEAFYRGILVEDILNIFGIMLRNCILTKKGIAIPEVDKHALSRKK